jgi:nicotinamidase-related amidase
MFDELQKNNAMLLCIDYQEKLLAKIHESQMITKNAITMIRSAQVLRIPIIVTEQYPKGLGGTVKDIVEALGEEYKPIEKNCFNCFGSSEFASKLKSTNRRRLLVMGIESHVCILQTVLEALKRKYDVYLLEDAISSRTLENRRIAIERMIKEGAVPSSVEMAIYEILKTAEAPEFKRILEFVK